MGRLTNLRPSLQPLAPRLRRQTDDEGHSVVGEPWRRWYKLARWQRLRRETFIRDLFTCQCGCGRIEGDTSKLVCDHIRPHRGDERRFWDPNNLQTLLKPCHDRVKQAEERRSPAR